MCHRPDKWIEALPTVLLGLRTSYKEDIKASAAEMLYGSSIRIPGEFFLNEDLPSDPQTFVEKHRETIRQFRPTPTAHHSKKKIFVLPDLYKCTHVFLRCDAVKKPLEQPYSGPYPVVKRITDRLFTILAEGRTQNISVDRLKPAHLDTELETDGENQPELKTYGNKKKRVTFHSSCLRH